MIAPKPIHLVNLCLLVLLVWAGWGIFSPSPGPRFRPKKADEAPPRETGGTGTAARPPRAHYAVIEQANIFKNKDVVVKPPEPTPVPPTPVPLPPLEDKLAITGTMVIPGDPNMKVIINFKQAGKTARSTIYGINDVIPDTDGAKIVEITKNNVVFERQGQRSTLELRPPAVESRGGTPAERRPGRPARSPSERRPGRSPRVPSEQQRSTGTRTLNR